MPLKRIYLWLDQNGVSHFMVAKSFTQARQQLLLDQQVFISLKVQAWFTFRHFTKQQLIIVTQQLAIMLKSGLPIVECLTTLIDQHPSVHWRWLLDEIKKQLIAGKSVSQTLMLYPAIFPSIYQQIIATGELTGQLAHCFDKIALQLEQHLQLQRKIKKAMRYPLFLLLVSGIVSLIMLVIVLPQFAEVYKNFDAQLPFFTQMMIQLSHILQSQLLWLVSVGLANTALYQYYFKQRYSLQIAKYTLKLPIIGSIIKTACLTQIFHTLLITLQSGIPLLSGLEAAQKTALNPHYQLSVLQIISHIKQGYTFSQAMGEQPLFPPLCQLLIRVGEESGTLELMLAKLFDNFQQNSIELTETLAQKIEPLMMSIMAIIIGSLVVAMYLPVFQLGNVIH